MLAYCSAPQAARTLGSSFIYRRRRGKPHQRSTSAGAGLGPEPAVERREPRLLGRRRGAAAREPARRALAGEAGRAEALEAHAGNAVREFARRAHREPGRAAGEGRRSRDLSPGLAGRGRRQRFAADVPRPVPLCRLVGSHRGAPDQQRVGARRPDPVDGRQERGRLFRAHRGRRRVGLRRRAERLRADALDDRGRRRGRALRRPARLGEEVRPHGRQGAGPDAGGRAEAERLAPDVLGVPTVLLARTDAEAADIVTTDVDENDKPFITGERTSEGFYRTRKGFDQALSRGLAYAEYADMVWCETGTPDLSFARRFAEGIRRKYPEKMLAYNCSPSFNWKRNLDDATIARFQRELGAMGYKFQFITLAGFHALNYSMFELAHGYARGGMTAFVELQQKEFAAAEKGFTAVKHQREVGTSYFDEITQVVTGGNASTTALHGSTEDEQFFDDKKKAKLAAV